jgi:hypothetical protein
MPSIHGKQPNHHRVISAVPLKQVMKELKGVRPDQYVSPLQSEPQGVCPVFFFFFFFLVLFFFSFDLASHFFCFRSLVFWLLLVAHSEAPEWPVDEDAMPEYHSIPNPALTNNNAPNQAYSHLPMQHQIPHSQQSLAQPSQIMPPFPTHPFAHLPPIPPHMNPLMMSMMQQQQQNMAMNMNMNMGLMDPMMMGGVGASVDGAVGPIPPMMMMNLSLMQPALMMGHLPLDGMHEDENAAMDADAEHLHSSDLDTPNVIINNANDSDNMIVEPANARLVEDENNGQIQQQRASDVDDGTVTGNIDPPKLFLYSDMIHSHHHSHHIQHHHSHFPSLHKANESGSALDDPLYQSHFGDGDVFFNAMNPFREPKESNEEGASKSGRDGLKSSGEEKKQDSSNNHNGPVSDFSSALSIRASNDDTESEILKGSGMLSSGVDDFDDDPQRKVEREPLFHHDNEINVHLLATPSELASLPILASGLALEGTVTPEATTPPTSPKKSAPILTPAATAAKKKTQSPKTPKVKRERKETKEKKVKKEKVEKAKKPRASLKTPQKKEPAKRRKRKGSNSDEMNSSSDFENFMPEEDDFDDDYDSEERIAKKKKSPAKVERKPELSQKRPHKYSIKSPILATKQPKKKYTPEKRVSAPTPSKKRKRGRTMSDEYEESDYDEYQNDSSEREMQEERERREMPSQPAKPKVGILVNTRSNYVVPPTPAIYNKAAFYDSGTEVFAAIIGKEDEDNDELIDVLGNSDDENDMPPMMPPAPVIPKLITTPPPPVQNATIVKIAPPTPTQNAPLAASISTRTISPVIVLTADSDSPVTRSQTNKPSSSQSTSRSQPSLSLSSTTNAVVYDNTSSSGKPLNASSKASSGIVT